MPKLWVIAGPNGAGKTTIADRWFATRIPVISPDYFAAQQRLNPVQAGKLALQQQERLLRESASFAIDTTISGKGVLALIKRAKKTAYKTNLVFVCIKDIALCHTRIAERSLRGGHTVPAADVARRYVRSLANLAEAISIVDRAFVLDNTGKKQRLLLSREHGVVKHLTNNLPMWAKKSIPNQLLKQSRGLKL